MKKSYGFSSVDFSVLDEVRAGELVMINGEIYTRGDVTRKFNRQTRCFVYGFTNEQNVKHWVHVRQQFDEREEPGLVEERMRKQSLEGWICNKFDGWSIKELSRR